MAFSFFTVPIQQAETTAAELNVFLRNHKVLAVERRWVDQGADSFWTFCIDYLETTASSKDGAGTRGGRPKVDYKEVLNPEEFAVFAKLRELRKELALHEAVPVYTIFTNEQLAHMVQRKATTKAQLEEIAGVGNARIEKYGQRVLELLTQEWNDTRETGGKAV